jgi:hypothetical protein
MAVLEGKDEPFVPNIGQKWSKNGQFCLSMRTMAIFMLLIL